ncbi:hypothetical protein SEA_JONJAMES_104 [Gordonia Phage JonJames]|nr:hypothetical protein SEA_JONJAMES_104 [Gordonia Phage JonJames]
MSHPDKYGITAEEYEAAAEMLVKIAMGRHPHDTSPAAIGWNPMELQSYGRAAKSRSAAVDELIDNVTASLARAESQEPCELYRRHALSLYEAGLLKDPEK